MSALTRTSSAGAERVRNALSSADGAALAGAAAAVLFSVSAYLLGRQPGVRSASEDRQWYADSDNRFTVLLALNLVPLGVVAFLWFMAAIRRRLGEHEDKFFATVFLGSGLAFAVLTLTASVAAAAPTLVVWAGGSATPDQTTVGLGSSACSWRRRRRSAAGSARSRAGCRPSASSSAPSWASPARSSAPSTSWSRSGCSW